MGYVAAFTKVEEIFPEAITIASAAQIKQDGVYLLFDGARTLGAVEDELSFTLAIVAHSYTKENGAMAKVDELRLRAMEQLSYVRIAFKEVKPLSFEGSTFYIVACRLSLTIQM